MAPLLTLIATFAVASFVTRRSPDHRRAGRVALAAVFLLTGVAHFVNTGALAAMVPPVLPGAVAIIYVTGGLELAIAAALVIRPAPWLGWALAVFLVVLLPANIYSAVAEVGVGGHGALYLLFRIPLQLVFIGWSLACTGAARWTQGPGRSTLEWRSPLATQS